MKPASLPTSIDIGPFSYKITIDELTRQRAQETSRTNLLGETDHDKLQIIIDASAPIGLLRETLLHETLHTIAKVSGLTHDWDTDEEEGIIQRICPLLLEVFRRNPSVVAYLMAE